MHIIEETKKDVSFSWLCTSSYSLVCVFLMNESLDEQTYLLEQIHMIEKKNSKKKTEPVYLKAEMAAQISQDKDIGLPNSSLKKQVVSRLSNIWWKSSSDVTW